MIHDARDPFVRPTLVRALASSVVDAKRSLGRPVTLDRAPDRPIAPTTARSNESIDGFKHPYDRSRVMRVTSHDSRVMRDE